MNQPAYLQPAQPLQLVKRATERLDEIREVARACEAQMRTAQQLKSVSAFGHGNSLAAVIYPNSIVGAAQLVYRLETLGIRWRLLGSGEQVLAAPDGALQDFVAVSLRLLDERLVFDGEFVRVPAGYSIAALVQAAAEHGLSGLEGLAGITGSLSSALRHSNGLIGRYVWSVVTEVVVADRGGLSVVRLTDIEERDLFDPQDLILAVTLKLTTRAVSIVQAETERAWHSRWAATPYNRNAQLRVVRRIENASFAAPLAEVSNVGGGAGRYAAGFSTDVTTDEDDSSHRSLAASFSAEDGNPEASDDDLFGLTALIRDRVQRELQTRLTQIYGVASEGVSGITAVLPNDRAKAQSPQRLPEPLAGKFE